VLPVSEIDKASLLLPDEYVITEQKTGIYSAMNHGVSASSGHYLYFLGKDDIVLPRFSEALDLLESKSPDSLFFDVFWGVKGLVRGNPSRWRILLGNICHQGIIYSRQVLLIHGPYLTKMHVKADHLLNIRVLWDRVHSFQVEYISLPLVWYSSTGFSSVNTDSTFWYLYPLILKKYVGKWATCLLIAYRKLKTLVTLLPDR
jgi:glycosyltransferase involved in cell wall biosynthesis